MTSLENECECKEFAMAWDDCCAYMAEKIIMNFFWLILYNFITEFVILKNIQICKIYRPTFSCFSKFVVNIESSELWKIKGILKIVNKKILFTLHNKKKFKKKIISQPKIFSGEIPWKLCVLLRGGLGRPRFLTRRFFKPECKLLWAKKWTRIACVFVWQNEGFGNTVREI